MDHVVSYIVFALHEIYACVMRNYQYEFISSLHKRFSTRNDNYQAFVFMNIMIIRQIRVEIDLFTYSDFLIMDLTKYRSTDYINREKPKVNHQGEISAF